MSALGRDDREHLRTLMTDPETSTEDGTATERQMAMEMGVTVEELRGLREKDRFFGVLSVIQEIQARGEEGGITDYMREKYELNERELFSLRKIVEMGVRFGGMGMGAAALLGQFAIGVNFAGMPVPEYTEEDHQWWIERHPPAKNYMGEDEKTEFEPDETHRVNEGIDAAREDLDES